MLLFSSNVRCSPDQRSGWFPFALGRENTQAKTEIKTETKRRDFVFSSSSLLPTESFLQAQSPRAKVRLCCPPPRPAGPPAAGRGFHSPDPSWVWSWDLTGQEADPVLPPSRFLSSPPASSLRFPLVPPLLCSAVTRSPPSPRLRPRTRGWEEGPLTLRESWQGPKGNPRSSSLANHCLSEQKLISMAEDCPVYIPRDRHRAWFLAPDSGLERARLAAPWPRTCSCSAAPTGWGIATRQGRIAWLQPRTEEITVKVWSAAIVRGFCSSRWRASACLLGQKPLIHRFREVDGLIYIEEQRPQIC